MQNINIKTINDMETTTKTKEKTTASTQKKRGPSMDPHKRLARYIKAKNVAGIAQVYCHNHIEARFEKEADRLTLDEQKAIDKFFMENVALVPRFVPYIVAFRSLIECNQLVGCAVSQYFLALERVALLVAQACFMVNEVAGRMVFEVDNLQQKFEQLKGTGKLAPEPYNEKMRSFMERLKTDKLMAEAIFFQKQYVGIIGGYVQTATKENKLEYFIPKAACDSFFSFKEGRDIILESVRKDLQESPLILEFFDKAINAFLPKMKDVKVAPEYAGGIYYMMNLFREAFNNKDFEELEKRM